MKQRNILLCLRSIWFSSGAITSFFLHLLKSCFNKSALFNALREMKSACSPPRHGGHLPLWHKRCAWSPQPGWQERVFVAV